MYSKRWHHYNSVTFKSNCDLRAGSPIIVGDTTPAKFQETSCSGASHALTCNELSGTSRNMLLTYPHYYIIGVVAKLRFCILVKATFGVYAVRV
jgi:hypothetical protein